MNQISQPVLLDPISGVPLDASLPTSARMEPGFDNGYWSDKHGPGPKVMAADTLQGDEVRNAAGEKLGELSHIMIDVPSGRVAYAVLSVGGFLGLGEKLLAIPWRALRIDTAKHGFTLDVSREKLDKAQGFDKDAWPSMADQSWAEGLHDYYGVHPYWR